MEVLQKLPIRQAMTRSSTAPVNPPPPPPRQEPAYETTPITSPRSLKQASIFFIGAACFLASTTITRRAIYRRNLRVVPKMFEPNTNPHEHFSPMHDALQALALASANCWSLGTMGVGGTLWAFDISGLNEMRTALRRRLGYESFETASPGPSKRSEESLEASILQKREEGKSQGLETPR